MVGNLSRTGENSLFLLVLSDIHLEVLREGEKRQFFSVWGLEGVRKVTLGIGGLYKWLGCEMKRMLGNGRRRKEEGGKSNFCEPDE